MLIIKRKHTFYQILIIIIEYIKLNLRETSIYLVVCIFFKDFIYLFLEKGEGKEKGEKH